MGGKGWVWLFLCSGAVRITGYRWFPYRLRVKDLFSSSEKWASLWNTKVMPSDVNLWICHLNYRLPLENYKHWCIREKCEMYIIFSFRENLDVQTKLAFGLLWPSNLCLQSIGFLLLLCHAWLSLTSLFMQLGIFEYSHGTSLSKWIAAIALWP